MITEEGFQYCTECMDHTKHRPKLDAAKNGQRVCNKCSRCNYYYDRDELLRIYLTAFNEELQDTWIKKDFNNNEKNAAHTVGKFHAICGDDVSSIDQMTEDEIIKEIIEQSETI